MNIELKDFDRTKHVIINGGLEWTRDLLIVELVSQEDDDNAEQTYSQTWRIVYLGDGVSDPAEVSSILHSHFYHFQECGNYQRVSHEGRTVTVTGGLDI